MPYLRNLTTGSLQTNSFLIGAESDENAILIDTPPESYEEVMTTLNADGRSLAAILITHSHFDHVWDAAKFFADRIPLIAMKDAVEGIKRPDAMGLYPPASSSQPEAEVTQIIRGGDRLKYAGLEFEVFEVPGHCNGSAAYYVQSESLCFVGDTVFRGSVGVTHFAGGDFELLTRSIRQHIYTLPDNTMILPGHGPNTEVGIEKRSNPYIREVD